MEHRLLSDLAQEDSTVDDLLAGFGDAGDSLPNDNPPESAYQEEEEGALAVASWEDPLDGLLPGAEAAAQPQFFAPQVCIDAEGNIVLNQSSLSKQMESAQRPEEQAGAAVEAVGHYKQAYRKTPATKWSDKETEMFYEALALYGTDLFLVQTFFRNKTPSQIKSKYAKEMRKNRSQVEEALTSKAKKLTKESFEKQHGKIDTTKHYQPQPTPEPGHEPEPDGSLPGQEAETPDPFAEPEYNEQDENLTTERLMALFD